MRVRAVRRSPGRAGLFLGGETGEGGPAAHWPGVFHVQGAVEGRGELAAAPGAGGGRGSTELGAGRRWHDVGRRDGTLRAQMLEGQRAAGAGVVWRQRERVIKCRHFQAYL